MGEQFETMLILALGTGAVGTVLYRNYNILGNLKDTIVKDVIPATIQVVPGGTGIFQAANSSPTLKKFADDVGSSPIGDAGRATATLLNKAVAVVGGYYDPNYPVDEYEAKDWAKTHPVNIVSYNCVNPASTSYDWDHCDPAGKKIRAGQMIDRWFKSTNANQLKDWLAIGDNAVATAEAEKTIKNSLAIGSAKSSVGVANRTLKLRKMS